jgi:AraC family transcriptional regulator, regulatory protein of adaptative response / methylated-DNA-[protein]-cysteine methyltransferase
VASATPFGRRESRKNRVELTAPFPHIPTMQTHDYERIARAIAYLEDHAAEQPSLGAVARAAGLSEFHFQRLFRRWAGVSPKRFLQFVTAQRAKHTLREGGTVLQTAYDVGLSGPSRLHDLLVNAEAVTPGQVRTAGAGLEIRWGHHATPFGECVIAATPRGICHLSFHERGNVEPGLERLRSDWPAARPVRDQTGTARLAQRIFGERAGRGGARGEPLALHVRGTNFQLKVWEALLRIPAAETTTYGTIAAAVGAPGAARAVGSAVGENPIAFVIPCHRVLRGTGALGGYRWGPDRKRAMLVWESARGQAATAATG